MPKENVNDLTTAAFRAEVSWAAQRDNDGSGYVQLATVNGKSKFRLDMLPGDESGPFDGWRVTLDRKGINRLIRSLRHARDAAFGADA